MSKAVLLVAAATLALCVKSSSSSCKGCVSVDEHNFDKIVPRFKAVLVKFDVAYPYGDKHEAFAKLAEELIPNDDIILAEVGVKDYGDKENQNLAQRYGVKGPDGLPAVKLFLGGAQNPVNFTGVFTVEALRNLIRDNANVYIGLPGCLETYDKLAVEFLASPDKKAKLKEVETKADPSNDKEKATVKIYLLYMQKIIDNGSAFIKKERIRLRNILDAGKVNTAKRSELTQRLNVLHSFVAPKEEL